MTKLKMCLEKLREMNESSSEYSIGLAQDISEAEQEVLMLYHMVDAYESLTGVTQRLLNEISSEF